MRAVLLGAVALLASIGAARAQNRISNVTGGQLGNLCASQNRAQIEMCQAYIEGISDAVSFYQFLRPADGSKGPRLPDYICVPGPTTGPQLRETVVSWLRSHPDAQRQAAAQVTMRALNDTYLCPGEQRRQ
ncbi:MAG: hypothetical protein JOZ05_24430 [Acetobacteraceae bacterium]|nr:hypothetical protein [Acetobacteraceae bacterium]